MPLDPVTLERFGGLRLPSDPGDIGFAAATEALNVVLAPDQSRIMTRDGSVLFSNLSGLPEVISPASFIGAGFYMFAAGRTTPGGTQLFLDRIDSLGNSTLLTTYAGAATGTSPPNMAAIGTPTVTQVYTAWLGAQLIRYDLSSVGPSVGKPGFVAVTPQSNRLIQARFLSAADSPTGANGGQSTVFFSNPGLPEQFSANNYVHLTPGDGEEITGMTVWRDLIFVFKETRAFVFYGESTDATGQPVFNYRQVTLSPTLDRSQPTKTRVVSGANGVYYITTDGVYRTTGGSPVKMTSALDTLDTTAGIGHMSATGTRVAFQVGTTGSHYVLDEINDQWTLWQYMASGSYLAMLSDWPRAFPANRTLFYTAGTTLYRTTPTVATDGGVAVASRYRTGVSDLGSPAQKVVREMTVDGSGNVNGSIGVDWQASPAGTPMVLGVSPAVGQARSRRAARGRNFRVLIDAASGKWSVNRLTLNVRSQRPVGVKQS